MSKPRNYHRMAVCRPRPRGRTRPIFETCEERLLLSNNGFLQGIVRDSMGNSQPGATVKLFLGPTEVATPFTTLADGKYLFSGLAPGAYTLVETPPSGFVNSSAS